jgi:hypothetical protein
MSKTTQPAKPPLWKPRLWPISRGAAWRANKDATLQPTPLKIVYPCGSPARGP